jgi:hypothetical protein
MDLRVKAWHLPPRLITGAYFLTRGCPSVARMTPPPASSMALPREPIRSSAS